MTKVHGEVYSIQHYVINFSVTCDRLVVTLCTLVSSTNKIDCYDITEIFLKVALSTIKAKPKPAIQTLLKSGQVGFVQRQAEHFCISTPLPRHMALAWNRVV